MCVFCDRLYKYTIHENFKQIQIKQKQSFKEILDWDRIWGTEEGERGIMLDMIFTKWFALPCVDEELG